MNKVGKGAMYMMGAGMIAAMSYYMGLPKNKKEDIKDKVMKAKNLEMDALNDLM